LSTYSVPVPVLVDNQVPLCCRYPSNQDSVQCMCSALEQLQAADPNYTVPNVCNVLNVGTLSSQSCSWSDIRQIQNMAAQW
jgi:hypothetical protein